jgi:hypothetical protein
MSSQPVPAEFSDMSDVLTEAGHLQPGAEVIIILIDEVGEAMRGVRGTGASDGIRRLLGEMAARSRSRGMSTAQLHRAAILAAVP